MPNEFITRNGFISNSGSVITGSLTATGGLTGSVLSASYSVSASFSQNSTTASYVISAVSASFASSSLSSSYALTASAGLDTSYELSQPTTPGIGYITPNLCLTEVTGAYTAVPGLDNIILTPFLTYMDCTLTGSGLTFGSTGSGVLTTARMGIYADNGNMLPGVLIQDLNIVSSSVTTLVYSAVTSSVKLKAKTVYWTAVVGNGALKLPVPLAVNGMYNPILQVFVTSSGTTSHRNIFSYGIISGSSSSGLPSALPSTTSSYTVNAYFTASGFIGPILNVVYG